MATLDFRARQIRTNKIISFGTNILVYPSGSATDFSGTINTSVFGTGSIGSDVFMFISGAIGGRNQSGQKIVAFGGDVHTSGSLSAPSFSGSHTKLLDDTAAFVAGPNITLTTQSNGAVAISGSSLSTYDVTSSSGWTAVSGAAGTSASIIGGKLRLEVPASPVVYGTVLGVWDAGAARGVLTLPAGLREVMVLSRVFAVVSGSDNTWQILVTALRGGGTDPADATGTALIAGAALPGIGNWSDSSGPYAGDFRADSVPGSAVFPGAPWSGTPTTWHGVRWTRGRVSWIATTESEPGIDNVVESAASVSAPDWGAPTQVVVAFSQYSGGANVARVIDVDTKVWCWT